MLFLTRYESTRIEPWSSEVPVAGELRQEHDRIIQEQDKGLEDLSKGLKRQQHIARDMQGEIKNQYGGWGLIGACGMVEDVVEWMQLVLRV